MKVYEFGKKSAPALLLLPGTCCHWKGNFGRVIPLLEKDFRVLGVSYDGFDETENTEFSTMLEETEKIEAYIKEHCSGHIHGAYGCSLGGSFVGLLAARQNIHMDYGILGSSDLDQSPVAAAKLQTALLLPLLYPFIRDGEFKSRILQKRLQKRMGQTEAYVQAFMDMWGGGRPYVTMKSCKNQFYSDLITPLPDQFNVPGTEIHIFYALKMGKKYRLRYLRHFDHPVIHEQDLRHEELLACYPEQWAALVKQIVMGEDKKVIIGSARFVFEDEGCCIPEGEQEKYDALPAAYSHLYLCIDGELAAVICIHDPLRREAKDAVKALHESGFTNVVMMTGDNRRTAESVAAEVGVDAVYAEVLPEDKAAFIRQEKEKGHTVIMVGDGVNDSPALSEADAGIAISTGAAIAREIADITVASEDLFELVTLRKLSEALMARIHGSYRFIVAFNLSLITLGVAGVLPPAISALLHNTSTLGIGLKNMTDLLEEHEGA